MLWAGMAATVAGVLAFFAVKEPWAHLTITQPATDTAEALVVEVTVRGHAAFVGTVGTVLAVMLAASGLLWFFYGFQRGWSMPGILNPVLSILVTDNLIEDVPGAFGFGVHLIGFDADAIVAGNSISRVGTGILRSSRNFTWAGRCQPWSRTGARIVSSGATAFSTISNRT